VERKNEGNSKTADTPPNKGNGETADARPNAFEIMQKFRSPGDCWVLRPPIDVYPIVSSYTDDGERVATKYRVDWVHTETGERRKDFRVEWLGEKRPLSELPLYLAARLPASVEPVSTPPRVSVILEGERKALQAALLWLHDGLERHHPEIAQHATFWGGYGSNVIPTPDAMAATLWNNFADTDTVVFAPDNDEAGRRWCANMIARAREVSQQTGRPLKLYVLEWRSAPEGGDLADLFERSLRPTADGFYLAMEPDADPWAELDVWRAAEWLEAHADTQDADTGTEAQDNALDWLLSCDSYSDLEELRERTPRVWLPVLGLEGVIAKGEVALVVAGPKVGKTTFLTQVVSQWDARVLYCTEESREMWGDRVIEELPDNCKTDNVRVGRTTMAAGDEWAKRVRDAAAAGYEVIVLDTLRALTRYRDECDAKETQNAIGPIAEAARVCGVTVVLVHHRNKYADKDNGTAGSNALDGIADVIIRLEPDRTGNERRRIMYVSGRVRKGAFNRVIDFTDAGEYVVVGDVAAVRRQELESIVLEACTDTWETLKEIADRCAMQNAVAPSERHVREVLKRLTDKGELECRESSERSGSGRPPKQYRRRQLFEPADAPPETPNQTAVQNYLNELGEGW
jgi:KaiC/GvpD/RAD55 family RecA-like ATPase